MAQLRINLDSMDNGDLTTLRDVLTDNLGHDIDVNAWVELIDAELDNRKAANRTAVIEAADNLAQAIKDNLPDHTALPFRQIGIELASLLGIPWADARFGDLKVFDA